MDIGVLVAALTALLQRTDLVTSPPVHASIVQLLLAMLSPQVGAGRAAQHPPFSPPARVWPACGARSLSQRPTNRREPRCCSI
jgi:hypothetical protein